MKPQPKASIAIVGSGLSSALLAKRLGEVADVTVFERGGASPQIPDLRRAYEVLPDPVGKIEPGLCTARAAEPTRGQAVALEFSNYRGRLAGRGGRVRWVWVMNVDGSPPPFRLS